MVVSTDACPRAGGHPSTTGRLPAASWLDCMLVYAAAGAAAEPIVAKLSAIAKENVG